MYISPSGPAAEGKNDAISRRGVLLRYPHFIFYLQPGWGRVLDCAVYGNKGFGMLVGKRTNDAW